MSFQVIVPSRASGELGQMLTLERQMHHTLFISLFTQQTMDSDPILGRQIWVSDVHGLNQCGRISQ